MKSGIIRGLQSLLFFVLLASAVAPCFAAAPVNTGISPTSGNYAPGVMYTFVSTFSDADGAANIKSAGFIINGLGDGKNSIYFWYDVVTNKLYIRNDANTAWSNGVAPGEGTVLQNSRASLYTGDTFVNKSGTALTVTWRIAFSPKAVGRKLGLWSYVVDLQGGLDGWDKLGTILVTANPRNLTLKPVFATVSPNVPLTMTALYYDQGGADTIRYAYFLLNPTFGYADSIYIRYDNAANLVNLQDDANTGWGAGGVPGSTTVLENTKGKVYMSGLNIVRTGPFLQIGWKVAFKGVLGGQNVGAWMRVENNDRAQASLWDKRGMYTVKVAPPVPSNVSLTPDRSYLTYGNSSEVFVAHWRDPAGQSHMTENYLLLNLDTAIPGGVVSSNSFKNGILVLYQPKTNKLWLRNDADTAWLGGGAPGTNTVVQNSQTAISFVNASVAKTSTDLTLTLKMTITYPEPPQWMSFFTLNAMMTVKDDLGLSSGWEQIRQYFLVPLPAPPN
ncbi:MAG: hypothetical protein WCL39_10335 [Armatimonadota bacterium]